ncbi:sensor histidine kinase [Solirhodobacter olei]|uniref:sensor histidine kinase n=1 Tax=Solirhodobacter olei TaxID=2493082 RepID=UPI000FDA1409|nr:HAMP domain-containing sensor histidine kinase [Solirhodobacter olei]
MNLPVMGQDVGVAGSARQPAAPSTSMHLPQQMHDYASTGIALFWQRMMSWGAGFVLAAYYYSFWLALLNLGIVLLSEIFDLWSCRRILRRPLTDVRDIRQNLTLLYLGTIFSSIGIVYFALWISDVQGPTTHFMPLFFLVAASVFAAMNNHQILPILRLRITIYGAAFLFIPAWDIWRTGANIHSELWMQMFTAAFVLYFLIDCSRIFLGLYRRQMRQMDELRAEHERTKIAYKAKTEFLSTMSHELRTPMTSINGAVSLARSGQLGEVPKRVDSVLGIAQQNCGKLSALINDILDLQKIEAGKLEMNFRSLELGGFLKRSLEINAPYGAKCNVTFRAETSGEPVFVEADENRLEQVMANLLSNAAKFSHPGSEVVVRLEAEDKLARILVIDQGVGLSEEHRELVFDQFSQLDSSDTRRIGGTGLGLNICRRILDLHHATIDYRKNEGPGTCFFIEMERCQPAHKADPDEGKAAA